jgi:hypothetical protein
MTHPTHLKFFAYPALALALVVGAWASSQTPSQNPSQTPSTRPADAKPAANGPMSEQCQALKDEKAKLLASMKADDTELSAQVAKMNSAPADRKLDLVATVVTRLVEQRAALTPRMEKLDAEMMKHMMQHMQAGKDSMSQCPMMKDMRDAKEPKGTDGKSPGTREEKN